MPNDSLFRKTPFNGYNRDDVTEYIIEQDEKIADLKHALDRKRNECEELKKQAEDAKAAENKDRLQQEIDNRDGIITVLDDMSQNEIKSRDEKIKELEEKLSAKKENEEDLFASQKENEAKLFTIQKELDELRALLTEKDAEIEKLKGENEKAKNESEEILKAAKIKSDYMVKNAEFFAFSTREKLLSANNETGGFSGSTVGDGGSRQSSLHLGGVGVALHVARGLGGQGTADGTHAPGGDHVPAL